MAIWVAEEGVEWLVQGNAAGVPLQVAEVWVEWLVSTEEGEAPPMGEAIPLAGRSDATTPGDLGRLSVYTPPPPLRLAGRSDATTAADAGASNLRLAPRLAGRSDATTAGDARRSHLSSLLSLKGRSDARSRSYGALCSRWEPLPSLPCRPWDELPSATPSWRPPAPPPFTGGD